MFVETLGAIKGFFRPIVFVSSSASVADVKSKMLIEGVARIPVIDGGGRTVRGIVRLKKLYRLELLGRPAQTLDDVMAQDYAVVTDDTKVEDAIVTLESNDELLIKTTDKGPVTHMLTPRGVGNWLYRYARPFRIVERLELAMRKALKPWEGQLAELVGDASPRVKPVAEVKDLNPRDYATCLRAKRDMISGLSVLSDSDLEKTLQQFAELRNDLMHFRPQRTEEFEANLERFERLRGLLEDGADISSTPAT